MRHDSSRLSFPVEMNHLPEPANLSESTQVSCNCSWYFSPRGVTPPEATIAALFTGSNSTELFSILYAHTHKNTSSNRNRILLLCAYDDEATSVKKLHTRQRATRLRGNSGCLDLWRCSRARKSASRTRIARDASSPPSTQQTSRVSDRADPNIERPTHPTSIAHRIQLYSYCCIYISFLCKAKYIRTIRSIFYTL